MNQVGSQMPAHLLMSAEPNSRAWLHLRRNKVVLLAIVVLSIITSGVLWADFISPYSETHTNRTKLYHPPTVVHWRDEHGQLSWPYVNIYRQTDYMLREYIEDAPAGKYYIKLFPHGEPHRLFGLISTDRHLFGVDTPAIIYLLGADGLGRDVFSRLLHGGKRSLLICLAGLLLSGFIGWLIGGLAGYCGGVVDLIVLNTAKVLMCIPSIYLLIALMVYLPPRMGASNWLMIGGLVLVNWPKICCTARNCVLGIRKRAYLEGARAVGAGDLQIIWHHVIPNSMWLFWVSMAVGLPQLMLGESSLSLLGIGIQEPYATWGSMLSEALNLMVLVRFPWLLLPGVFITLTVLCWGLIAENLTDAAESPRLD
jgi:peptide/nickel transport system permease protein